MTCTRSITPRSTWCDKAAVQRKHAAIVVPIARPRAVGSPQVRPRAHNHRGECLLLVRKRAHVRQGAAAPAAGEAEDRQAGDEEYAKEKPVGVAPTRGLRRGTATDERSTCVRVVRTRVTSRSLPTLPHHTGRPLSTILPRLAGELARMGLSRWARHRRASSAYLTNAWQQWTPPLSPCSPRSYARQC